ncbi:MAG TPA: universal stress protein [Nitrospira sp.]|nr:universal stress protein [Nitrospira sp.]
MGRSLVKQIVFATDFSEYASRAQNCAAFLAKAYEANLQVLHVAGGPLWYGSDASTILYLEQARQEGEKQLAAIEQQLIDSGVTAIDVRQPAGIPSEEIKKAAQDIGADLVVVATRGRTGLEAILLGSTAERVIKDAPCPVLAVPASLEIRLTSSIQHVMAPLDFSSPSLDAAEYAIQVANHFGAKMTLIHVLEPIYYGDEFELRSVEAQWGKWAHWREQLDRLAGLVGSFGLATGTMLRGGVPADSIVDSAKEQGCDLIVMGTHGRRGWVRLRFGSVAEAVLRQAPCPVLTVKSPKFEPGHRRVMPQTLD